MTARDIGAGGGQHEDVDQGAGAGGGAEKDEVGRDAFGGAATDDAVVLGEVGDEDAEEDNATTN